LNHIQSCFQQLIANIDCHEAFDLFNFHLIQENIYAYDPETKSVRPVSPEEFPWPIIFIAGRFHKKHRFLRSSNVPMVKLSEATMKFSNKIKWQAIFKGRPFIKFPFKAVKRKQTTPFFGSNLPQEATTWLGEVQSRILKAVLHPHNKPVMSKMSRLSHFCLNVLQHSGYTLVQNDKDGGYSLVKATDIPIIYHQILQSSKYDLLLSPSQIPIDYARLRQLEYESTAKDIAATYVDEEKQMLRHLMSSMLMPNATDTAALKILIKSHKLPGKVSARNLHSISTYSFGGISRWLAWNLFQKLKTIPWIIKNTSSLVHQIKAKMVPPNTVLMLLDIKEYFISGTKHQLLTGLAQFTSTMTMPNAELILRAADFLLEHQYIKNPLNNASYQSLVGSGMGLAHSGELCDSVYFALSESTTVGNHRWLTEHNVYQYHRFKDDILIMCHCDSVDGVLHSIQNKQQVFQIELDTISTFKVHFLEIFIMLDRFGCIHTKPAFKPTSLTRPLASHSSHLPMVHLWPVARVSALFHLSSNSFLANAQISEYIGRFVKHNHSSVVVDLRFKKLHQLTDNQHRLKIVRHRQAVDLWLTLPFHPSTYVVRKAIISINKDAFLQRLAQKFLGASLPVVIRTAWSNEVLPSITDVIYKSNSRTLTRLGIQHTEGGR
jgi:hypothetical protein